MRFIAEVIESSTRHLVAEVLRDEAPPAFGAWVEVPLEDGTTVYAVVSHVEVGSIEPGRRAMAMGLDRETLRREMPQVLELVRTTFRAQVVAYRDARAVLRQTLPPCPAALHDRIRCCVDDDVAALAAPYDVFRTLLHGADERLPVDDLLAALLRRLDAAHGGGAAGRRALIEAGQALARLLGDDHERLQSILRRAA